MNKGGLCPLVAPNFIPRIGLKVMDYIRCIINEHILVKNGPKTLQDGFNKLIGNDELFKEFIESHGENACGETQFCNDVFKRILEGTFNARSKLVSKDFNETFTGRYAKGVSDSSFRQSLKSREKGKCEEIGENKRRKLS